MSVFVVRVERMSAPAIFGRRVVRTAITAVTTDAAVGRVHLVSLASELAKPAGERASATTPTSSSTDDIWILSETSTRKDIRNWTRSFERAESHNYGYAQVYLPKY